MADYKQPDFIEKRLRYFDGQFLKDQDFIDEQKYFVDRLRRYSRLLNVAGIIEGLAVKAGTNQVTVDPGTALDTRGRLLVLGSQQTVPLQGISGPVDLVISYNEEESDKAQAGSEGFTRFHENPKLTVLRAEASPPEAAITLARLTIEAGGVVTVNNTGRVYAGLRLPYDGAGPGQELSLRAGDAGRLDLTGSLRVSDKVGIGTTPKAKLEVAGNGGTSIDLIVNGRLQSNNNDGGLWVASDRFVGGHATNKVGFFNGSDWRLTVQNDGSVGIGTTTPKGFQVVLPESSKGSTPGPGVTIAGGREGNASIELRNNGTGTPYIDFAQAGTTSDYDARIRLTAPGQLAIEGANVGISASSLHLQLRRGAAETTGGKQLFLELFQEDPSVRVPEVFPSIRFHHGGRFWHRLEARSDGFHFKEGNLPGESYVTVHTGSLQVNGSVTVAAGQAVTGIPIIDFQMQQQRFANNSGAAKTLTYTFAFSRPVLKAQAMLGSWFLRYANRELVKEAGVGCYNTRISGNTATVDVMFYWKDATGNYDDPYEGEAIVVMVAQLSQTM